MNIKQSRKEKNPGARLSKWWLRRGGRKLLIGVFCIIMLKVKQNLWLSILIIDMNRFCL